MIGGASALPRGAVCRASSPLTPQVHPSPASQSSRRFAERFSRTVRNLSYIKRLQKVQYPEGMLVLWWDYNV